MLSLSEKIPQSKQKKDAVALASGRRCNATGTRDGACAFSVKEKG
jgi:hypothetical protein